MPILNLSEGRFCVFCGERPKSKNNEHIIPRWLIKRTGDLNREFSFGINFSKVEVPRKFNFSFNTFHFPSCKACNDHYGKYLEIPSSKIVDKIFSHDKISFAEITLLLSWFDKLRTGLWLALLYLNKSNLLDFYPHFFISSSIGVNDRFLAIYRLNGHPKGITILGVSTPAFIYYPFCFGIVINDLLFIQGSYPGWFFKSMGFAYPTQREWFLTDDQNALVYTPWGKMGIACNINPGREKVKTPFLRTNLPNGGVHFYQSVINSKLKTEPKILTEYVKSHTVEINDNLYSKIWINSQINSDFWVKDINVFDYMEKIYQYVDLRILFETNILRIQKTIIENSPSPDKLPEESRRRMHYEQVSSKNFISNILRTY